MNIPEVFRVDVQWTATRATRIQTIDCMHVFTRAYLCCNTIERESMGLQGSTGRSIDPKLHLLGDTIPYAANGPNKFLGMHIHVPHDRASNKEGLINRLQQMLDRVDAHPVTRHQTLRLYKAGICPQLSWLLNIQEFPITWVERVLATRYLKKWAGLAKSANTALLYLPQKKAGMNLLSHPFTNSFRCPVRASC